VPEKEGSPRCRKHSTDRLPPVAAVSDYRPCGRLQPDVDGQDDAATARGLLPFKLIFFVLIAGGTVPPPLLARADEVIEQIILEPMPGVGSGAESVPGTFETMPTGSGNVRLSGVVSTGRRNTLS
jgi:hypothetical protein